MENAGTVNGGLDTTRYASPIPIIGLYIAAATLVCCFCMAFDMVHGFVRRKLYLPCKLFPVNSFTLSIVAVATKIPVDLTTSMPRCVDQLSKLTGTAFLCISLGFFMPSLDIMKTSEGYANMGALSIMVITVVVNMCIQMATGVVFAFTTEHFIIIICMLVLLILLWSSTLSLKGHRNWLLDDYTHLMRDDLKDVYSKDLQGLRPLLEKLYFLCHIGNSQSQVYRTKNCHTVGLLCAITSIVVLEAALRSFAFKEWRFRSGVSDYGWSIPLVVVTQIFTIIVGAFTVIVRGHTLLNHISIEDKPICAREEFWNKELLYLRNKKPSFKSLGKCPTSILHVIKDFIINVLMTLQDGVCLGTQFVVIPFYFLNKFLAWMMMKMKINIVLDMHHNVVAASEISNHREIFAYDGVLKNWIIEISKKDMERRMNAFKRDYPGHLIRLLEDNVPQSQCTLMKELQITAQVLQISEYRVSIFSLLVLARMIANMIPNLKEDVIQSLKESFQIIYFIDQSTNTSSPHNEFIWRIAMELWEDWDNPKHWFETEVMSDFKKPSGESSQQELSQDESELCSNPLELIRNALQRISYKFKWSNDEMKFEVTIICKFILDRQCATTEKLHKFMEITFVEMLHFLIRRLPLAILNKLYDWHKWYGDPSVGGEERMNDIVNFLYKLEMLGQHVQWSWPTNEVDATSQNNPLPLAPVPTNSTITVAYNHGSEIFVDTD